MSSFIKIILTAVAAPQTMITSLYSSGISADSVDNTPADVVKTSLQKMLEYVRAVQDIDPRCASAPISELIANQFGDSAGRAVLIMADVYFIFWFAIEITRALSRPLGFLLKKLRWIVVTLFRLGPWGNKKTQGTKESMPPGLTVRAQSKWRKAYRQRAHSAKESMPVRGQALWRETHE